MGMKVEYPANSDDWYAKGNFEDGTYFEVPAVFNEDGSCNIPATDEKISAFYQFLQFQKSTLN